MNHKMLINIIICLSIAVPCLSQITNGSSSFVINEIQTGNIDQYIDYSNNYGGWIEIYNPTSSAITPRQLLHQQRCQQTCGYINCRILAILQGRNSA